MNQRKFLSLKLHLGKWYRWSMFFLHRKITAVFASKRQNKQTMDIEMEDCASYEDFCYSMNATKKSRLSSYLPNDSESDAFDWEADSDESDDDIEWSNDEQSYENEESMDDFEILFEEQPDMCQFEQKENRGLNEPYESINENGRSTKKILEDDNSDIDWSNVEQSSRDETTNGFEIYFDEQPSRYLQKVNRDWDEVYKVIDENDRSKTKVSFAPEESLVEVLPADECDRKGEWMMYAIDRMRFQKRIEETEAILSPYLSKENRSRVSLRMQTHVLRTILIANANDSNSQ